MAYESYKNLFESLKKKAKKKYYSEKISKYKHDAKRAWSIMKELIRKIKVKSSNLPRRITVNEVHIFDKRKIANEFNAFFTNIGSKLASKILNASTTFESYINKPDSIMKTKQLSINALKDVFFSLKINKGPGYHDISFNVLKKCFSSLCEPLKYLFNLSIEKGIFPDELKIAKVTPIYNADDKSDLSNYRPISVLSCFSKILERIMHNRLYQYLTENKILYPKQSGFQTGHSTEHAIVQLVIKFLNLLNTISILWVFLSTYLKPMIQSIIQYFLKNWNYMV